MASSSARSIRWRSARTARSWPRQRDGAVRLWDVATRRQIGNNLAGGGGPVYSVAFSPDGKTLASGSVYGSGSVEGTGTLQLLDVATRQPIGNTSLTPTARSTRWRSARTARPWPAAAAMARCGCGMWPPASRSAPLTGHTGPVYSVAFSPDGKTLASGSGDGAVRLWDVATRQQIGGPLTAHAGPVYSVAFSPDGKTLASGSGDGTVRLWDVAYLVDIVPDVCALAGRSLTRAEWTRYVPRARRTKAFAPESRVSDLVIIA